MGAIKKEATYQFKSDEKMFEKWQSLKSRIDLLAGIVQNDHKITGHDLEGWVKATKIVQMELDEIIKQTQRYIASTIKEVPAEDEKYKVIYEDHTADDIVKAYVTVEEYDQLLKEDGNNITILRHPKIPSK